MRKNVAIVIRALSIGGAEKQSLLLARSLNHTCNVYLFVQKNHPQEKKHLDFIEKERINYIQLTGNLFNRILTLRRYFVNKKIHIVFSYLTSDNFVVSMSGVFITGLILFGGVRNCWLPKDKFIANVVLNRFFMHHTIFNNYSGKNKLIKRGFSGKTCIVIHNCYDNKAINKHPDKNNKVNIISVGRFVAQKDYYTALLSIKQLQKISQNHGVHYRIIGYGTLEPDIREFISSNGLSNVELIINPPDLNYYFNTADIYLSTSKFEGLSNSIMEALNYELPVVATNAGDNRFLVKDNKNGFLCKVGDFNTIAEKLSVLVRDEKLRIDFGKSGKEILINDFSVDTFKKKYISLIENTKVPKSIVAINSIWYMVTFFCF